MVHRISHLVYLLVAAAACLLPIACTEDESGIGIALEDPLTQFDGKRDTLYANAAFTVLDDSLRTSNYSYAIIGNHADAIFGPVSSTLYTQIALPSSASSISFGTAASGLVIDSVVLSLVPESLYPDTTADYRFHFEVRQLAEPVLSDTTYYSTDQLPIDPAVPAFYDQTYTVHAGDTIIRLRMLDHIGSVIATSADADEFLAHTKGLRIRIVGDADPGMLTINCAALKTALIAYYHYEGIDTTASEYSFDLMTEAAHFTHFEHDYSATRFNTGAPVVGDMRMYLEPLGGHNVKLSFDEEVKRFVAQHPYAVIHYAEMRLVPAPESDAMRPDRITAFAFDTANNEIYINDIRDPETYLGFDGRYYDETHYYRLRVTQHLQGMLRDGGDKGTLLVLNSRRNSGARLVLGGYKVPSLRPSIVFVYSE